MEKVVRVDRESLAYSDPWTRRTEDRRSVPLSGHLGAELRDELLTGEIFYTLKEAKVLRRR